MQIGDSINFVPFVMRYNKGNSELQSSAVPGRVVWIHPEGRYAVRGARDKILYIPGVHPGEKEDH